MEQKKEKARGRAGRPRRENGRDQRGRRAGRQGLPQYEAREAGTLAGLPALRPPRGHGGQFLQELLPPVQGADALRLLSGGGGCVDTLLPVIKDFLKDPVANAEILASHKVDTAKYQQQAETENVKQEKK